MMNVIEMGPFEFLKNPGHINFRQIDTFRDFAIARLLLLALVKNIILRVI